MVKRSECLPSGNAPKATPAEQDDDIADGKKFRWPETVSVAYSIDYCDVQSDSTNNVPPAKAVPRNSDLSKTGARSANPAPCLCIVC